MIKLGGEPIEGTDRELSRDDVDVVIKIGSTNSPISLSNPALLEIPTDLPDGTKVRILFSQDGNNWEDFGVAVVINGKFQVVTDHFSYFAVSESLADELGAAPLMDTFVKRAISSTEETITTFQDIAGHWAEDYIEQIANLGIVSGKTPTSFAPNDYITRAELTKIAINAFGFELSEENLESFIDVDINAWYAPYISTAKLAGIISGYGNGRFNPNWHINRAEALKILLEAADFEIEEDVAVIFEDTIASAWYIKYVNFASKAGIVGGYPNGTFGPDNNITRAEVAKVVTKILELKE